MRGDSGGLKRHNREFLSQKNLRITRLISDIDEPQQQQQPEEKKRILEQPDALSQLLQKAQNFVLKEQEREKKVKAKSQRKALNKRGEQQLVNRQGLPISHKKGQKQQKDENGAFLTHVQIAQPVPRTPDSPNRSDLLDEQVIKLLSRKSLNDDLEQLRRQIKATDHNLKSYHRKVENTRREVTSLAGRYNSYFNLQLPVSNPTLDFATYSLADRKHYKRSQES